MLTPRLPPPFLTQDILSWLKTSCPSQIWCNIPHSTNHGLKSKKNKNKKKTLIQPSWFLCLELRNLHAAWRRMKRQMCCSLLCEVIDCVLSWVDPTSIWSCSRLCVVVNHWQCLSPNNFSYTVFTIPRSWFKAMFCFKAVCLYTLAFCLASWSGVF